MSKNQAICYFCSKPDDSIQVICASRCLICSKCQLVPTIRKLHLDHCEIIPFTQLVEELEKSTNIHAQQSGGGGNGSGNTGGRVTGGKLPHIDGVHLADMTQVVRETSTSSILFLPPNFAQSLSPMQSSTSNSTLLHSSNFLDDAINTVRSAAPGGAVTYCMRGFCPICSMKISVGMLQIVLEYKEAIKTQYDEEATGKSSANFELEEVSALIPNFLKRYKYVNIPWELTY
jgi:hypothetical protein